MGNQTPGIGARRDAGGAASGIDTLLVQLRDFDDQVRVRAISGLSRYRDQRVTQAIVGRLKDRSAQVRWYAIDALVAIGDQKIGSSIESLLSDSVAEVRAKAAEALGLLQCKASAMRLVETVDDQVPEVAKQAGIALGKLKENGSMQELIGRLDMMHIYEARCFALAQFGQMAVRPVLLSCTNMDSHTADYLRRYGYHRRTFLENRQRVLLQIGTQAFDEIATFYDSKKIQQPVELAKYTENIETTEETLFRLGFDPTNVLIAMYLALTNDSRAMTWLCRLAQDDPPVIRWLALGGLATRQAATREIVTVIVQVLQKDYHPALRWRAAQTLGILKAVDAVTPLCTCAMNEPEASVAQTAVVSLGQIADARAVPSLVTILINDDRDPVKRRFVAEALGKMYSSESVDALISALGSDGDEEVRIAAAKALGNLKDRKAVGPLKIVAGGRDESVGVMEAAKSALAMIGK